MQAITIGSGKAVHLFERGLSGGGYAYCGATADKIGQVRVLGNVRQEEVTTFITCKRCLAARR